MGSRESRRVGWGRGRAGEWDGVGGGRWSCEWQGCSDYAMCILALVSLSWFLSAQEWWSSELNPPNSLYCPQLSPELHHLSCALLLPLPPPQAVIRGTLRSFRPAVRDSLMAALRRTAGSVAEGHRESQPHGGPPHNHSVLSTVVRHTTTLCSPPPCPDAHLTLLHWTSPFKALQEAPHFVAPDEARWHLTSEAPWGPPLAEQATSAL